MAQEQKPSYHKPDYHEHEEFQNRSRKLNELNALNIPAYPHHFHYSHTAATLEELYSGEPVGHSEDAQQGLTPQITVSGRLVLFRAMGKNAFAHTQDHTGRVQIMFNRDDTKLKGYDGGHEEPPLSAFKIIEKKFDLGDIIGVKGHLFRTQKGELTLYAKEVTLLCKTLLPLADKHAGLHDKELRYRKRWLDLISNPEITDLFRKRSLILSQVRKILEKKEFIEVETPVLQSTYGGAEAKPFTTLLNALHQEMFLRISLEIPLKKLIVGGMHRVFEIGRVFRNEGIDRNHNPEFTMLEAYAAYWDYNDMMKLVEELFESCALLIYGKTKIPCSDREGFIDVKAPWKRLSMKEAILEYGKINTDDYTTEALRKMLLDSGHCEPKKLATLSRGLLIAAAFEVFAEAHLIQPHHIIDHPIETTPLCKPHRNQKLKEEGLVERFESFILGQEICNAYTELNDPVIQRRLLELQADRKDAGDEEAAPLDEEFIEAICQGMPPTGGIGIGIDRMMMILLNQYSIRDVLYFPWMKPANEAKDETTQTL